MSTQQGDNMLKNEGRSSAPPQAEPERSQRARANSNASQSLIVDTFCRWETALKNSIRQLLYRQQDIDDIAQETFLRAYDATRNTHIKHPKAYLFRVAKHVALNELTRKSTRLTDYLEDAIAESEQVMEGSADLEDELIAQQSVARSCDAIASMPKQCRRVFLLRKVHALSHREIAETMGISVSAVEKHFTSGLSKYDDYLLAKELAEESQ